MLTPKEGSRKSGKITPTHGISDELKVHHSCSPEGQVESTKHPRRINQQGNDVLSTLKGVSQRFSLWDTSKSAVDDSQTSDSSVSGYYSGLLSVDPSYSDAAKTDGGECSPPVRDTGLSVPLLVSTPVHLVPPLSIRPQQLDESSLYLTNVRLTEQVGILTRETDQLLQDKTNLVCRVDSLKTQLDLSKDSGPRVTQLRQELQNVLEARGRMEVTLTKLKTDLDKNLIEKNDLQHGLNSYKSNENTTTRQLNQLKEFIDAKEEVILSLKSKIAELYTEMNLVKVSKESFENDTKKLIVEIESIQRSQAWYKEQLKLTQEARSKLQLEITNLDELLSQGAGFNEELIHENSVVRLKLSKMEQYVLEEKRTLAAELEVVRGEMIEREAIFEQILLERNALEEMVNQKQQEVQEASVRVDLFSNKVGSLEAEIAHLASAQTSKLQQLENIEMEKSELAKNLFCLQESMSQKDGVFEEQCVRYNDLADKLRKLDDTCREKIELIDKLVEEKSALEVNLLASKREKDALDKYMSNLKGDMVIVEESFRKLRYDLDLSNRELASMTAAKADLTQELTIIKTDLANKVTVIARLIGEKEKAEVQFNGLYEENCLLQADRVKFQKALEASELKVAQLERAFQCEKQNNDQAIVDLTESRAEVTDLKASLHEIRLNVEKLSEVQTKYMVLLEDHKLMNEKYDILSKEHKELVELFRQETSKLKQEIADTKVISEQALESKQVDINNYEDQLKQLVEEKVILLKTIAAVKAEHVRTLEEKMGVFRSRLRAVSNDLVNIRNDREQCRALALEMQGNVVEMHKDYQEKLKVCFEEMQRLQERIVYFQGCEDRGHDLEVELEKARGKALGLEASLDQVKQHSGTLQDSLGCREASLLELEKTSEEKLGDVIIEKDAALDRLRILEEQVQEADAGRNLLRENMSELEDKFKATNDNLDRVQEERDLLAVAQEKNEQLNFQLSEKLTAVETENCQVHEKLLEIGHERAALVAEGFRLESQWREAEARESAAKAELNVSRDRLDQALKDIDEVTSQMQVLENKHTQDMEEADVKIKSAGNDRSSLNSELTAVRQEKLRYQRQLAHLRGSLRAAIQRYRLFTSSSEDGHETSPVIDVEHLERLLEDSNNMTEAKPTRSLNRCLDRLYNEMNGLRDRMTEHTGTVHSSVNSWKDIEAKAKELQKCCDEGKVAPTTPIDQPERL